MPPFCDSSNILDGNALRPGARVEYVLVMDHINNMKRAEQISGGVRINDDHVAADALLMLRQQAEIEALRAQLAMLTPG